MNLSRAAVQKEDGRFLRVSARHIRDACRNNDAVSAGDARQPSTARQMDVQLKYRGRVRVRRSTDRKRRERSLLQKT